MPDGVNTFLPESVRTGEPCLEGGGEPCLDGGGDSRVGEVEHFCLGETDRPPDSDSSGTMDVSGPSLVL